MSAQAVWKAASAGKQEGLRHFWPELYAALAGTTSAGTPRRPPSCPVCTRFDTPPAAAKKAVGRLTFNGTPACAECIRRAADRPGGYPLELQERQKPLWT